MKIYTKTGDIGETSLFGGKRVSKSNLRIEAYGTVDELNAQIGLLISQISLNEVKKQLIEIQDRLFTLGSSLAADPENDKLITPDILESDIEFLEKSIDKMEEELPPLQHFILPGGHVAVAQAHVVRTVCRRAERRCVELNQLQSIDPLIIKYLNRLSDYFFVTSRYIGMVLKVDEVKWLGRKKA